MSFFTDLEKLVLKIIWNNKRPRITKIVLSNRSHARGITISDFKLYYKTIVIMVLAQKQTHRPIEQNRRL